jgi:hypothetical protein
MRFIEGLKDEIRPTVLVQHPKELNTGYSLRPSLFARLGLKKRVPE